MTLDSEHEVSFLGGIWESRLKAKDIYRQLRQQRQVLQQKCFRKKNQGYIGVIAIIIISLLFMFIIFGLSDPSSLPIDILPDLITNNFEDIVGFSFVLMIFAFIIAVVCTCLAFSSIQNIRRDAKRFGVLGIIAEKLAAESSLVDLFADFGNFKNVEPYASARSPYSGSLKLYYYLHWLRYDTNLNDGTKFLLKGGVKVKTKGGSIVRSISIFNFRFSFAVHEDEHLTENQLRELEEQIGVMTFPYFNLVFTFGDYLTGSKVVVDYPSGGVLRFELKIWGHSRNLVPGKLVPIMLREFNANLRSIYPSYSGFPLRPLKVAGTVQ